MCLLCLTGSKEARIFWEVWEDSQSGNQQQHIVRWVTGEQTAAHRSQQRLKGTFVSQSHPWNQFFMSDLSLCVFFPQGPSASAYVTYIRSEDALRAIQCVNNVVVDGRTLKVISKAKSSTFR